MDRAMPSNLPAERYVLAAMITNPDAYDRVLPIIEAADFFADAHRHVFAAITALEGQGVELITVIDRLRRAGRLDDAGGASGVAALLDEIPDHANIEKYAGMVKEASLRRRAIVECHRLQQAAYDPSTAIGELAASGAQMFSDFAAAGKRGPIPIRQMAKRAMERLDAAIARQEWMTGITTGIQDLDGYTLGIQRGVLSLAAARPRVGKTAWMISTTYSAIRAGYRVLFVELDMSEPMFSNRCLAFLSGVSSLKIRSGQGLNDDELSRIDAASREMYALNDQLIVDYSTRDIARIAATVRREARKGLDLVIVDHIGHVRGGKGEKRYIELGDVSSRFIEIAGETNAAVLALVQLSREAEDRPPVLSDLRESGNLEQDARLVVLLDRPALRGDDVPPCRLDMYVPKNEGEAGHKMTAHFDLHRQRVTDSGPCVDCRRLAQPTPPPVKKPRASQQELM